MDSHYEHVVGTLQYLINSSKELIKKGNNKAQPILERAQEALDLYNRLMEEHPEVKRIEESSPEGYLPESIYGSMVKFTHKLKEELEPKSE